MKNTLPQTYLLSVIMLLTLFANIAFAQTDANKVLHLLKGYEWKLDSEKFLNSVQQLNLTTDADLALSDIASDTSLLNVHRFRAIQALSLFNNERVANFLENYMHANPQDYHVRRAFAALAKGFSKFQPDRIQNMATKMLNNPNGHIRMQAAKALKNLKSKSAQARYERYLKDEKEDWVLNAMKK